MYTTSKKGRGHMNLEKIHVCTCVPLRKKEGGYMNLEKIHVCARIWTGEINTKIKKIKTAWMGQLGYTVCNGGVEG